MKQFNLQKQKFLSQNCKLPGLKDPNNVRRKPGMVRNNGMVKKNVGAQQRAKNNVRDNLRKLINMRMRNGNMKGMANAKLMAERKRRLQQWRQFVKNRKKNRNNQPGALNSRGGGNGNIATAVLNDGPTIVDEPMESNDYAMNIEDSDQEINLDEMFGQGASVERLDNEPLRLFDDSGVDDDDSDLNVNLVVHNPVDEVINGSPGVLNASDDDMSNEANLPK